VLISSLLVPKRSRPKKKPKAQSKPPLFLWIALGLGVVLLGFYLGWGRLPKPRVKEQKWSRAVLTVDGRPAVAGLHVIAILVNEGWTGPIKATLRVSCAEGQWSRTHKREVVGGGEWEIDHLFTEPPENATDLKVVVEAAPDL